jgi:hypothetical protein
MSSYDQFFLSFLVFHRELCLLREGEAKAVARKSSRSKRSVSRLLLLVCLHARVATSPGERCATFALRQEEKDEKTSTEISSVVVFLSNLYPSSSCVREIDTLMASDTLLPTTPGVCDFSRRSRRAEEGGRALPRGALVSTRLFPPLLHHFSLSLPPGRLLHSLRTTLISRHPLSRPQRLLLSLSHSTSSSVRSIRMPSLTSLALLAIAGATGAYKLSTSEMWP